MATASCVAELDIDGLDQRRLTLRRGYLCQLMKPLRKNGCRSSHIWRGRATGRRALPERAVVPARPFTLRG